jgi:iron(III) transport system substrate-binding protein
MKFSKVRFMALAAVLAISNLVTALPTKAQDAAEKLVVYSGRTESLIAPLLKQFTEETGIVIEARYGSTAEMAATILEEGANSPADVYIAQDAGALGAVSVEKRLRKLPTDILERVAPAYVAQDGTWVGISGRARVLVYNTELVKEADLPKSLLDLTDKKWDGKIGWAPSNGSLQAHITAMRVQLGDDATQKWLEGVVANNPKVFDGNANVVAAVVKGEISVGLVNNYYLMNVLKETPDVPAANYYFPAGDIGSLINVAGAGILDTSKKPGLSQRLLLYLLGKPAQGYFATQTNEYPLVAGVNANEKLLPLEKIEAPEIDLSKLSDLQATLDLMRATKALP